MDAPSVGRRLKHELNAVVRILEIGVYYVSGRAADPTALAFTKPDNAGPIRSNITDIANFSSNYIHNDLIDSTINKALTGDYAPKPSGMDIAKAVAPTFARYASQILRTPLGMGSAVALCGAAIMLHPQVREDMTAMIDNTVTITAEATDKIGKKIVDGISPTKPVSLATIPIFKPVKS